MTLFVRVRTSLGLLALVCSFLGARVSFAQSVIDANSYLNRTLFLPRVSIGTGKENWDICAADFNLDGFRDIAVVSKNDNTIRVMYNNGAASFDDIIPLETVAQPRAICVLDANSDAAPDLAIISLFGEVALLLNDGAGNFRAGFSIETDMAGTDIASADVNADGYDDLAVSLVNGNTVWVLAGNGAGGFAPLDPIEAGIKPRALRLADFNLDTHPDLLVGCDDGQVHLFFNAGDGTFAHSIDLRASADTWGLAVGDLDGNGEPDIITSSYTDAEVCVFLAKGPGKFALPQRLVAGEHNFGVETADFDKDGDLDIIACSTNDKQIYFYENKGKGIFESAKMFLSGYWNSALVASDFDQDGDPDVITVSINDSKVNIHRNIVEERAIPEGTTILKGTLYNHATQLPAAMTPITICNSAGEVVATTISNDKGQYAVGVTGDDVYSILAKAGALPIYCAVVQVNGDQEIEHNLAISQPGITQIDGQVTSARDGSGISRALVRLFNSKGDIVGQTHTTQSGMFRITARIGEVVRVLVSHRWYQPAEDTLKVALRPDGLLDMNIQLKDIRDLAAIEGTVFDQETREPLGLATVLITDANHQTVAQLRADLRGQYLRHLPPGKYYMQTQTRGYYFAVDSFEIMATDLGHIFPRNIALSPLDNGSAIVLEGILFPPGDARVDVLSIPALKRVLAVLEDNPDLIVEISGHTDTDGADAVNMRLSQARAQSVVSYLTQAGIQPQRLVAKGYGETRPIAPNDSAANKYKNRRIELTVVGSLEVVGDNN